MQFNPYQTLCGCWNEPYFSSWKNAVEFSLWCCCVCKLSWTVGTDRVS